MIDAATYLTSAELPEEDDPTGEYSKTFQEELTNLIRGWQGWRPHTYSVSQENCLFGYACVASIDPFDWKPQFFRQDEFGVPDGTGQHAEEIQFIGFKQSFLIHELLEKIEDKTAAEDAGWEIAPVINAINKCLPDTARRVGEAGQTKRQFVDLIREGSAGMSHEPGARSIDCYHLLSREASGKVSHTILWRADTAMGGNQNASNKEGDPDLPADTDRRLLFDSFERFEKMSDVVALYSFEPGNGKLYGSKGLGRDLINLHLANERARNRMADQAYLGSTTWIKGTKGLAAIGFKVRHPFTSFYADGDVVPEVFPANLESLLKLDERLSAWAEDVAGAYIPRKLGEEGPERTATETIETAKKENEERQAFLQRFFGQFADEITMITKRACDPECEDERAKAFRKRLEQRGIDAKMLKKFASQPAADVVHDIAQIENQAVAMMCEELKGNPYADQQKVMRRLVTARVSKRFADDVLLKDQRDPETEAQAVNHQILENAAMRVGESVNVAPNDNHDVETDYLIGDLKQSAAKIAANMGQGIMPHPRALDNINAAIVHGEAHLAAWEPVAKATKNQDDLQKIEQKKAFFTELNKQLEDVATQMKQARDKQAEAQMQAQPNGAAPPEQPIASASGPGNLKFTETIPYDKAPESIKRQLEAAAGLTPAFGANPNSNWLAQWSEGPQGQKIPLQSGLEGNSNEQMDGETATAEPGQPATAREEMSAGLGAT